MDLYIFNAYDLADNVESQRKEWEIYNLPRPEDYDGMLLAVNSVGNIPVIEEIISEYKAKGKHILSIEQDSKGVYYAGVDNYQCAYKLVEHMIVEHGCHTFNFLGGPESYEENQKRLQAFHDCLQKHNITPSPERIRHYSFLYEDGWKAYEAWKKEGIHLPEAVICANDNMALGYCQAAEQDGYFAPKDFCITGFDNTDEGQYFFPSITSVNRNWEQLGYDSAERMLELIEGKDCPRCLYMTDGCRFNESCGCADNKRDIRKDFAHIFRQKKREETMNDRQSMIRQRMCASRDEAELFKNMEVCQKALEISQIAVCLVPSLVEEKVGEAEKAEFLVYAGREQSETTTLAQLVPESWEMERGSQTFLFGPLYFAERSFGYCVMSYREEMMLMMNHRSLMETFSLALENIRQRKELNRMNRKLKRLYVMDSMTELYNRFGYGDLAESFYREQEGKVFLVYLDLDRLKQMNDNYGHSAGDCAIRGMAEAIRKVFEDAPIRVRMGGDEFLVMGKRMEAAELLKREEQMQQYLENYCQEEKLPFGIQFSMGYVQSEKGNCQLEELVREADSNMYQIKKKKKALLGKRANDNLHQT